MVALAAVLALGCGDEGGADAGTDAGVDVAVADMGGGADGGDGDAGEADAGWCLSTPCMTRLRVGDTCVDQPRTGFSCDAGPGFYDGECISPTECVGTPCECSEGPCCDGCLFVAMGEPCAGQPVPGRNKSCSGATATWDILEYYCDGDSAACGGNNSIVGEGSGTCPEGMVCRPGGAEGMRCQLN